MLRSMNAWCVEHHGKSGLTQRVRDSKLSVQQAEEQVLDFIKQHVEFANCAQLAGNSIHMDRMFLVKHMPALVSHLNYRVSHTLVQPPCSCVYPRASSHSLPHTLMSPPLQCVDVSTVRELARRWHPQVYRSAPRKVQAHTALSDVRESIAELRYYRQNVFRESKGPAAAAAAVKRGGGKK